GVEKAAAVGAEHLNGDLGGDWTHSNRLFGAFKCRRVNVRSERLRNALPDQKQRVWDADGEKDVQRAAGDINPEATDSADRMPRKASNERNGKHDAGRGREIILMR